MKSWPLFAGYLILYVFMDWVSYIHPLLPLAITPWNPPPGLSLTFLLLHGLGKWPVLFFAALLAEIFVREIPAPFAYLAASSLALTACYSGAAALLLGPLRFDTRFRSLRDLSWFLAVVLAGALLAALAYVAIYAFAGLVPPDKLLPSILRFWVGDVIGIMVIVPLLLAHTPFKTIRWRPTRETAAQGASVVLALWVIFGLEFTDEFKFFYLLFLPLVWITMRHGIRGATLAILGTQLGLIAAVQVGGHKAAAVIELQLLMLALAITGLFLGMAVSSRRLLEDRLREQQVELDRALRFAAAGEMTSALAHELNQPLSALTSYLHSCQLLLTQPEIQHTLLTGTMGKAVDEARRAGQVVHRLRNFYRGGIVQRQQISIPAFLQEGIAPLLNRAERHNISVRISCPQKLPDIRVDRVQMETVLHNLVYNSIDAIAGARSARREIIIDASVFSADEICICTSDTGPGITSEMQPQVFEPFTTGKIDGTGLGLAISRSLVEANHGKIWLDKSFAGGARFCFSVPVSTSTGNHD
ncbi:MAG: MASE1 domain-containing protein [Sulfuricella sp.]|nr:MASE1 domain-containing protein [Sulfuricella sp.]